MSVKNGYRMVKFDDSYFPEHIYEMSEIGNNIFCNCFAGNKSTCRHREMLLKFSEKKAIDTGEFYDFEEDKWYPPLLKWED